jgi:hypothetical protein
MACDVDRYTVFRVTHRRLLNLPPLQRAAQYETYDCTSTSQTPITNEEAWEVQLNVSSGYLRFPIAIQPLV